jgi:hypothetical protein
MIPDSLVFFAYSGIAFHNAAFQYQYTCTVVSGFIDRERPNKEGWDGKSI